MNEGIMKSFTPRINLRKPGPKTGMYHAKKLGGMKIKMPRFNTGLTGKIKL